MFITVKLISGFTTPLTYKIPSSWNTKNLIGSLVTVPLQKRKEIALVLAVSENRPEGNFVIREALSQEHIPHDAMYHSFIAKLAHYHALEPAQLYQRLKHILIAPAQIQDTQPLREEINNKPVTLTHEQQTIVDAIVPDITQTCYTSHVIHGVTGSGKTEVYKQLIIHAHNLKKTTLFLVPEVSLAVRFLAIFKAQLPSHISVYGFHSATSATEKKDVWNALLREEHCVVVGVHLPILLPLPKLGCIIVDEEHDTSFQSNAHPRINARDAAIMRAQESQIPIILGSATPSLNALYNVQTKGWKIHTLTQRFKGAFPTIEIVSLTKKDPRKQFWISTHLEQALADRLTKKEQSIIFLNRRGMNFFVQCSSCGHIATCASCSVSLTLHEDDTLRCHYCGYCTELPKTCQHCAAPEKTFLKKGIGTQQVVALLSKLFPHATIARADLDSTVNKKKWQATLEAFDAGKIDILVGTQTITKGYHFPRVTLVGIIWADINLSIPFYNASEVTLQQLIQVAGRAGRERDNAHVIVQTMTDNKIYSFINEKEYCSFYKYESSFRKELEYPPYTRFARIEIRNKNATHAENDAQKLAHEMHIFSQKNNLAIIVLGPVPAPVHKIKNVFSYIIYLKSPSHSALLAVYTQSLQHNKSSSIFFTPQPQN